MRVSRLLALALVSLLATGTNAAPRNVLLLVAEDLSPRIGSYGDTIARTPNLDALATESTRYTRAFTTAGVCAPSRAALITGQHQISFGAQHMRTSTSPLGRYLARPPSELRAFPELLRQHGYFTFTDRKLDYQFSGIGAGTGPFSIWDIDGANDTAWREREPGQPFFGMINLSRTHESGVFRPTGAPHSETHARTQAYRSAMIAPRITDPADVLLPPYFPDIPEARADLARHYDNIGAMDARVGRILGALKDDGLFEQTIVIWTADHGDGLPRAKRELYDSGINVPLLVRDPERPEARIDDRLVSFVDVAPTVLDWAGVAKPAYLHGRNFLESERRYVYASRDRIDEVADRQRAIRDTRYKYIRSWRPEVPGGHALAYRDNIDMVRAWRALYQAGRLPPVQARWFEGAGKEQLYDTDTDPHEVANLADEPEFQSTKQRLMADLETFLEAVGDWSGVPEEEMRTTLLVDGKVPLTPDPTLTWRAGTAHLASPIGASIGWRLPGETRWRLYRGPLKHPRFTFKSVRYGWQESQEIQAIAPLANVTKLTDGQGRFTR